MRNQHSAPPRAGLWTSLCEGRPPGEREVDTIAAKVWRDLYSRDSPLAWEQVEVGSPPHRKSMAVAMVALGAPATAG
ncbi:MAG: hypothetical protein JWM38_1458 [Sphingomonas bacterium]|jgi:hypothetical protein|nr:hypothetical protein [Sphingomonas bacterium]MDB5718031.1 hypothetical protein [Sphingomonas bacterium]